MTEKNIDHLIALMFVLGLFVYFLRLGKIGNEPKILPIQNSATPSQKTNWDKFSTVSTFIAAIAALVYAVVKMIELCKK